MKKLFVFGYTEQWYEHYWYSTTPVSSSLWLEWIQKAHVRALIEVTEEELDAIEELYRVDRQKFGELLQSILQENGAFIAN